MDGIPTDTETVDKTRRISLLFFFLSQTAFDYIFIGMQRPEAYLQNERKLKLRETDGREGETEREGCRGGAGRGWGGLIWVEQ